MNLSVRVPGFLPTINGLHFTNSFPAGFGPDYTFKVLGQTITLGDASNGLCGGMVYTVKDLFDTGLLPPADTALPAEGSPLFNYLVARLTRSFDEDDVNQYLSWIQMSDHDTGLGGIVVAHGLAWHEISEEWPKIKGDLDAGRLSPLGLVHGQEPPTVGFFTGMQDLGRCHQVLAWGYDLNGSSLTLRIYDPDSISDQNTITLDIGNPGHTTPISVSTWSEGSYRGFFRTHYAYHDPRRPVSAAFLVTVVNSPGITSAGPIRPTRENRTWIDAAGNPLVRFTGHVHDWSSPLTISAAEAGKEILQLNLTVVTGDDDLRGGNSPHDNCDVILTLRPGRAYTLSNINQGKHWNNGETHTVALALPAGTKAGDITGLTLHTQFGGGIGGDNWNVNRVSLQATL